MDGPDTCSTPQQHNNHNNIVTGMTLHVHHIMGTLLTYIIKAYITVKEFKMMSVAPCRSHCHQGVVLKGLHCNANSFSVVVGHRR